MKLGPFEVNMLEKILLRRNTDHSDHSYDAGRIAEALLFYGETHFLIGDGELASIIKSIGVDHLRALVDEGHAKVSLLKDTPAFSNFGGQRDFGQVHIHADEKGVKYTLDRRVRQALVIAGIDASEITSRTKQLLKIIHPTNLNADLPGGVGLADLFRRQIAQQPDHLFSSANIMIRSMLPPGTPFPAFTKYRVYQRSVGDFHVDTDLDIALLSSHLACTRTMTAPYDPRDMLLSFFNAFVESALSARYGAGSSVSPLMEELMLHRVSEALHQQTRNRNAIQLFSDQVLDSPFAVRDVINRGERTFQDFLIVLRKAAQFKAMLKDTDPSIGLLKAYLLDVQKGTTWVERAIPKRWKFSFFTGAGLVAGLISNPILSAGASVGLSYADTYLAGKLRWGWHPNLFVQDVLKPFTGPNDE